MRVHVVSDVHGRVEALARAGEGADAMVCLGDLLLYVDYADPAGGIMGDLFGGEAVRRFIDLRDAQRFGDARAYAHRLWEGIDDPRERLTAAVRQQYSRVFAAFPTPTYATFGNVDVPSLWSEYARDGIHVLHGQTIDIGGRRFGFVGGGLRTPMRAGFELSDEEYAEKVAALGPVDVLCCHIPPALPELTYDVVARRFERGSVAVLEAIQETQPSLVLFGHIHQPLQARIRIGRTECVNVGHFRQRQVPYVLEW